MTVLHLHPHPLGLVVRTELLPGERELIGDVSELLCEGDSFGGLSFEQLKKRAGANGSKIDAAELKVE